MLRPGGWYDFTFDRTEREEHHVLREDFSCRTETLVAPAEEHGFTAESMDDWEALPHGRSKLRIRPRSPRPAPTADRDGSAGPGEVAGPPAL